jgi:hypothetical protein
VRSKRDNGVLLDLPEYQEVIAFYRFFIEFKTREAKDTSKHEFGKTRGYLGVIAACL